MDLLDDILLDSSAVKAPARPKFQPKAKPKPKKGPSVSAPPVPALAQNEKPVASVPVDSVPNQSVQPGDFVNKNSEAPSSSSLSGSAGTKPKSYSNEACNSENVLIDGNFSAEAREVVELGITRHSENSISKSIGDAHLSADRSLGSKCPQDIIVESTTAVGWPADVQTLDASTTQIAEEIPVFPDVNFASSSPFRPCSAAHDLSIPLANQDSGCYREDLISNVGDFQRNMEQVGDKDLSGREAVDIMSEAATASGIRAVKFQPKPKAQSSGTKTLPKNQKMNGGGSIPSGEPDNILLGRLDEDFTIETSTAQSDSEVPQDMDLSMLPEESAKDGERETSDASNFSHESLDRKPASPGLEANDGGYEFLDDDTIQNSPAEVPDEPAINMDKSNEDDNLGGTTSKKKRPKTSNKAASENDKPARKRKKQSKAPEDSTEQPPKKFPHATRRKRSVNKSLLEAPEGEIDFQRVPIRDLIILAEYKERQAKKEAPVVQPPSTSERTDNSLPEDLPYEDDDLFDSDQETGPLDNSSISRNLKDTRCFNYQTHTNRQKRVRWSKQDTELFYQGVQQFGSDLSLIAELFPGKDREHIKSKYKKEERQHPMRLHDALTSRAKDHSHFEFVIQRLEEQAAQRVTEEAPSGDDNLDEEEELDEETLQNHEEAAKSEQKEEGPAAHQEPDRAPVTSSAKSFDDEDDFDWITYESK